MVEQEVLIVNPTGLHARPASQLCSQAQKFRSKITLVHQTKTIDAKSILNIMAGGLRKGSTIVVRCEGEDEAQALETLVTMIQNMKE
jgi:phosphotransferase system HPr (HPr) family protein